MDDISVANIASGLWAILQHNVPGIAVRLFVCMAVLASLGLLGSFVFYRLIGRSGLLHRGGRVGKFTATLVVLLVVVSTPLLTLAAGACVGAGWSAAYLIHHEHLGERAGRVTFKAVVASVASERLQAYSGASESEKLAAARSLLQGEEKIPISELKKISAHHAGEVSAEHLHSLLPIAADGPVHKGTVWLVEKSVSLGVFAVANHEGDILYKFTEGVVRHDAATDKDGLVTVEEVSDVACKTFLDRTCAMLAFHCLADPGLLLLGVAALLLVLPYPLSAAGFWLYQWGLRRLKAKQSESGTSETTESAAAQPNSEVL